MYPNLHPLYDPLPQIHQEQLTQREQKPLFDDLCSKRLGRAIKICEERGQQYGDTLRNGQWLVTIAVLKKLDEWGHSYPHADVARALAIAGLCDVKYQRFEGGYKTDHCDDGINYFAVLAELMEGLKPRDAV